MLERLTVTGAAEQGPRAGNVKQYLASGGAEVAEATVRYGVVYEQTPENWSAYVPDLPGCVAAADTREEVEQLIREAIGLYLEALSERHERYPSRAAGRGSWRCEAHQRAGLSPVAVRWGGEMNERGFHDADNVWEFILKARPEDWRAATVEKRFQAMEAM